MLPDTPRDRGLILARNGFDLCKDGGYIKQSKAKPEQAWRVPYPYTHCFREDQHGRRLESAFPLDWSRFV